MKKQLKYQIEIDKNGNVNWELFSPFQRNMRRCRWMAYYGNNPLDEFGKIIKGWHGNLTRDLDHIWYRTEIIDE